MRARADHETGLGPSRRKALALNDRRRKIVSYVWMGILTLLSMAAIAPLFFIFSYAIYKGAPGLNLDFFTELPRAMGEEGGGMSNAIVGSAILIAMASAIGIPWGIAAGIYLSEYRQGFTTRFLRFTTDLLTSVPSIIIGLFAYALIVVPFHGYSAYAGSIALAIIIVPIVARTTEEILKLLPVHIREAGLALGLPRWKVILRIVLPASLSGVVTGLMLAIARVAGETAPLLFTSFSNNFGFRGLGQPTASLPVQIFNFATSHDDIWRAKAWTGALVLVLFVFIMNLSTRLVLSRGSK
ncbi:MAG: phosphate ABC transporter permease PstA [Proteobacteria bacterium]|nr:MAG: phosphate ABC transporter permease PstA [Pseudomonadota bacterium]